MGADAVGASGRLAFGIIVVRPWHSSDVHFFVVTGAVTCGVDLKSIADK